MMAQRKSNKTGSCMNDEYVTLYRDPSGSGTFNPHLVQHPVPLNIVNGAMYTLPVLNIHPTTAMFSLQLDLLTPAILSPFKVMTFSDLEPGRSTPLITSGREARAEGYFNPSVSSR